jgi:hypothetical protein
MFLPRISRLRAAIFMALAVVVWSDAALASFVCPHMSGCEHGMPMPVQRGTGADQTAAGAMPCCPMNSDSSFDCGVSAMECCAWHHSDSSVSAILFSSDQPRPKQLVAVLPVDAPDATPLTAHASAPGLAGDLPYIKPVPQKKTDLRI